MPKMLAPLVACLLGGAVGSPLLAQRVVPLSLEARVGGAFATGQLADPVDAGAGYSLGVDARLDVTPDVSIYAGYQRAELACAGCEDVALDGRVVDAGFEAGAILALPLGVPGFSPWLRAGLVLRTLEFSGDGGSVTSEPGVGFAAGAGVDIPLAGSLALAPGIHFRSYSPEFDFEFFSDRSLDVSHVGVELGLVYHF